jgi:TetR/AcrR family transcriptional regulator, regulator of cefoperazone and chloramphenicol sensitivity
VLKSGLGHGSVLGSMKRRNIVRPRRAAAGVAATLRPRRVAARGRADRQRQRTGAQLIEVAGRVFAEQGFDGATGQDICRRAGVNSAAIVYHFGGMAGLHRAVLEEAQRRLVTTETLAAAVRAERDPRRQLEAFLGLIVRALTSPVSQSWAGKLFSREWVTPSTVYGPAHDRALAARSRTLKSIVSALTGRPADHALVARGCISVMAPCALLLLVNRRKLRRLLPQLHVNAESAPQLTRHLVDFALAGLGAISGRRARR